MMLSWFSNQKHRRCKGEALEQLMRDYLTAQLTNERLSRRYDACIFSSNLLIHENFPLIGIRREMERWCEQIRSGLAEKSPPSVRYNLEVIQGEEGDELLFSKTTHGVTEEKPIKEHFFKGMSTACLENWLIRCTDWSRRVPLYDAQVATGDFILRRSV